MERGSRASERAPARRPARRYGNGRGHAACRAERKRRNKIREELRRLANESSGGRSRGQWQAGSAEEVGLGAGLRERRRAPGEACSRQLRSAPVRSARIGERVRARRVRGDGWAGGGLPERDGGLPGWEGNGDVRVSARRVAAPPAPGSVPAAGNHE